MQGGRSAHLLHLLLDLEFATAVGEPLLEEAVLQLLPEQLDVALELERILDAARLQVGVDEGVRKLQQAHPRQVVLGAAQLFSR